MISKNFLGASILATALAILVAPSGAGCGGATGSGAVDYSVSAQKNYDKGMKALEAKDWIAASKYFAFIKSRFPYSKYATLAELRLAVAPWDVWSGVVKSCVFGVTIAAIGCRQGLATKGAAAGVGRSTTDTVVHCLFAIVVLDVLLTMMFRGVGVMR